MAIIDGRTWMEHLPEDECWSLLASTPVGRVAVLVDGRPEIYPVNMAVEDRTIVFRTDPGSKLRALDTHPEMCLEADGLDAEASSGWSVVLKGSANRITDADELARAEALPLRLWSIGDKAHWIRVRPDEVTGRRLRSRAE